MKYVFVLAVVWSISALGRGFAQEKNGSYNYANTALSFLSIITDARAGGMGELGVATLPDGYSHQQNAAKYIFLENDRKGGANLFYVPWLRHLVNDMYIAGASAFCRIGKNQSVSASFRYFSMGDLHQTDENLQELGDRSPYEWAVDGAYARRLGKYFSMSVGFRWAQSSLEGRKYRKAQTMAFDLNGYYGKPFYVSEKRGLWGCGFGFVNMGGKVNYGGEEKLFLPAELKFGSNVALWLTKEHCIAFGGEVGRLLVTGSEKAVDKTVWSSMIASFSDGSFWEHWIGKLGIEYTFQDVFAGRVGYYREGEAANGRRYLTFGAGVGFGKVCIDGSYLVSTGQAESPLRNTFRLSAGIRW